jgi:hypothetical protein
VKTENPIWLFFSLNKTTCKSDTWNNKTKKTENRRRKNRSRQKIETDLKRSYQSFAFYTLESVPSCSTAFWRKLRAGPILTMHHTQEGKMLDHPRNVLVKYNM